MGNTGVTLGKTLLLNLSQYDDRISLSIGDKGEFNAPVFAFF